MTRSALRPAGTGPQSLGDKAYDTLRHEIITCMLRPGADLGEQEIARRLRMSKTPVREALARLTLEGLIEAFPRRGYQITPVTVKDVNDIFVVRRAVEGVAAGLAAQRLGDDEIERIAEMAEANYTPGEEPSVDAFVRQNDAFHRAIAEGARVPRLSALVTSYLEESTRLFYMGAAMRDVNTETLADHAQIVEALRSRDPQAASEAVVRHAENTRRGLLTAMIEHPDSSLEL